MAGASQLGCLFHGDGHADGHPVQLCTAACRLRHCLRGQAKKPDYRRDGHEQATVHAEQNAVSDAARRGVSLDSSTVYITHFPCINCAKILAAAGVRCIKYHRDYRNDELVQEILAESGILVEQL